MRYDNGKIYRITNNIDEMIYIGSTCLPLRKRFYCHKTEQHAGKGQNRRLFMHAEKYGWKEFDIYLLEDFPCDDIGELRIREEFHRKHVPVDICLNMYRAYATDEDRKLNNKQSRQRHVASYNNYMRQFQQRPQSKAYQKQWHADNRDKRNMQQRERTKYQTTWGGNLRSSNNLLRIDTALFT